MFIAEHFLSVDITKEYDHHLISTEMEALGILKPANS